MRLNGRGLANIWEHEENKGLDIDCYEFQSSDFGEGVVVLSVEEAKALLRRSPEFKENGDWQLPIERLKERIFKAEGK